MSSEVEKHNPPVGELILVICFAILTSLYLYQTFFLERTLLSDFIGPARFPQLVASVALILCAIYFIQRIRERRKGNLRGGTGEAKVQFSTLLTLLPIVLYALLLEPIGFLFSTAVFVFVEMMFFGQSAIRSATYALTISIAFFVLFYFALLSQVPMGNVVVTDEVLPFVGDLRRAIEG